MSETGIRRSVDIDPAIRAVEVKITARIEDEERVLELLDKSGEEPEARTIYFFDTPELALFEKGLVLRARKVKGDDDDSVVKLRPVDPARIEAKWLEIEGFEIEMDRVGENEVISAKLKSVQQPGEIDEVAAGTRSLYKLFSRDQERLIEAFGPPDVGWEHLRVMGPITVSKWQVTPPGFAHEVTAERWILPDQSDLVELSIKVEPPDATQASVDFVGLLEQYGLGIDDDQQTKTKGALRFFTAGEGFD